MYSYTSESQGNCFLLSASEVILSINAFLERVHVLQMMLEQEHNDEEAFNSKVQNKINRMIQCPKPVKSNFFLCHEWL